MPRLRSESFRDGASKLGGTLLGITSRKAAVINFAKKYHLIYFQSVRSGKDHTPVIRGTSVSPDQVDAHYCIGSHDDYDMAFVERTATVAFEGYATTKHRWYVLQIDLKHAHNLPFMFLGTKQQTKAYYGRVLTSHREARYLSLNSLSEKSTLFHATYALLASPAELHLLYRLFTDEVIESIVAHRYPFAIEIDGDSIMLITEAKKANEQLLDELLHYGLWMAKTIDERLM